MKTVITVLIIALNIFSIILNTKMLKGYEKTKIVTTLIIGEIIIFIISSIIYAISSGGIPDDIHKNSKWMILLTLIPINMILIFCPFASQINKKTFDEITEKQYRKRMILFAFISIVIIIFEVMYVKDIQLGIVELSKMKDVPYEQ